MRAAPSDALDTRFIAEHRKQGRSDATIARMGGWCEADVSAIPRSGAPRKRLVLLPPPREPLRSTDFPEICEILLHVSETYCVTVTDILGDSHDPLIVEARHEAMAVACELNRFTARDLAEIFRKTVPAITYGLRRHYERLHGPISEWND